MILYFPMEILGLRYTEKDIAIAMLNHCTVGSSI